MKTLLLLFAVLVLAGCASTSTVVSPAKGFGPYVEGPMQTPAINYIVISLY